MQSEETLDIQIREKDLPILAGVAAQALRALQNENIAFADIERLIRTDPALASRILRLANSPLFAGRVKAGSISQAVSRLGLRRLKNLILLAATGDVFQARDRWAQRLSRHSVAAATASQWLAGRTERCEPEEAFLAGFLHDIGKTIIYAQAPEAYGALMEEAARENRRFYEYEKERIAYCNHSSIGAVIARKWDMSETVVEVIRFHHDVEQDENPPVDNAELTALVSLANLLANSLGYGDDPIAGEIVESLPAQSLNLDAAALEQAEEELPERIDAQISAFAR